MGVCARNTSFRQTCSYCCALYLYLLEGGTTSVFLFTGRSVLREYSGCIPGVLHLYSRCIVLQVYSRCTAGALHVLLGVLLWVLRSPVYTENPSHSPLVSASIATNGIIPWKIIVSVTAKFSMRNVVKLQLTVVLVKEFLHFTYRFKLPTRSRICWRKFTIAFMNLQLCAVIENYEKWHKFTKTFSTLYCFFC